MKLFVILCFIAVVAAAPAQQQIQYSKDDVQVVRYDNDNLGDGNFKFSFEQTDGTQQEQEGRVINEGTEDEYVAQRGSFAWVGPDGVTYRVIYTADDKGYQPEIEQGPGGGVPPAVIASLLG